VKSSAETIDFSQHLERLGADLCRKIPELLHIDPDRVLFCLSRSRAQGIQGVYARISPLRFTAGKTETSRRRGRFRETFRMPSLTHQGREILYLVHVMVPRFLRLSFEEKLGTVIHELFHISERCDGDIRRFPGRNFAHGASREGYNRRVRGMLERYLAGDPDPSLLRFLHLREEDWVEGRIRLSGLTVPLPRARLVAREKL
jgi:hypothetical protein